MPPLSGSSNRKGKKTQQKYFAHKGQHRGCLDSFQVISIGFSKSGSVHQGGYLCKAELSIMGSPGPFTELEPYNAYMFAVYFLFEYQLLLKPYLITLSSHLVHIQQFIVTL